MIYYSNIPLRRIKVPPINELHKVDLSLNSIVDHKTRVIRVGLKKISAPFDRSGSP